MANTGATYRLKIVSEYHGGAAPGLTQLAKQMAGMGQSVERGKRREVLAHQRAAREVERIGAQTTRQAEQHARMRERIVTQSTTRAATAQVRAQRTASNEVLRLLDKVRRAEERPPARPGGRGGRGNRVDNFNRGVRTARNVGYVAGEAVDTVRGYTSDAMRNLRSEQQFRVMNLGPQDTARGLAAVQQTTRDIKGVRQADVTDTLTSLVNTLGGVDEAIKFLPIASKYRVNMESLYGDKYSSTEITRQIGNTFKALETLGVDRPTGPRDKSGEPTFSGQDQQRMEKYFNLVAQATSASGGEVNPSEFRQFTKYAKLAGPGLTPEGLTKLLPVVQQLGGASTGTAMMTLYSNMVGGRIPVNKLGEWERMGLLDRSKVELTKGKGSMKRLRPGAIPIADNLGQDPVAVSDKMAEAFRRKGIDTQDFDQVNKQLMAMFGDRTGASAMAQMINFRASLGKEAKNYERSMGINETYDQMLKSPLGKFLEYQAATANLRTTTGAPIVETGGQLAEVLAPIFDSINTFAGQHQNIAAASTALLGLGASAIAATEPTSKLSDAISLLRGGSGGGGAAGGGGIGGTGVGVSDLITGAWAGGQGIKAVGGAAARGGLGMLGKVPGPLGIAALIGALGYGLYKDDKDTGDDLSAPHRYNKRISVDLFRQLSPEHKQPERMKGLIRDVDERVKSGQITKSAGEQTIKIAGMAFPESYKTATSELAGVVEKVSSKAAPLGDTFVDLLKPTRALPDALGTASTAASRFADRVGGLHVGGWPVFGGQDSGGDSGPKPSMQTGAPGARPGYDSSTGSQPTHSVGPRMISSVRAGAGVRIESINVNLPPGTTTGDPQELARMVGVAVRQEVAQLDFNQMIDDRTDFKVGNILERG